MSMNSDIEKVLFTKEELADKISEMGKAISRDYKGESLLLVSVLKGSVVFMADLMRAIDIECQIDFMVVSSYGNDTVSKGNVKVIKDLDIDLKDYSLLLVEDILDSGMTLNRLKQILSLRQPKSIKVCTLLDKPARRKADINADYKGFDVPDEFIVGYGLDYAEKYRNLPYIGILKPEIYSTDM